LSIKRCTTKCVAKETSVWAHLEASEPFKGGPDSLGDQRVNNGTEPSIVTPAALAGLRQRIKAPPDDGGVWSGPKVARWLATFHALKSVHAQRGWDALVAIEYSMQKPRPRHPEAASNEDRAKSKKTAARRR
jgi:hypothetical protein